MAIGLRASPMNSEYFGEILQHKYGGTVAAGWSRSP
jgi:hypothetical protein